MEQTVNHESLQFILGRLDGQRARFARVESRTIGRANVKSRTTLESFSSVFGTDSVWKLDDRVVLINCDYSKVVNRRRVAEGKEADFEAAKSYGNLIGKCLYRLDKDNSVQVRTYHVKHRHDRSVWVKADGTPLSPELVARLKSEFLPPRGKSVKQGLDNEFKVMNFKMESIRSLTMGGVKYIVQHA